MSAAKKSNPKKKTVAKVTIKTKSAPVKRQPSEVTLAVVAVCITFLLLVDTYYIWVLIQANS